MTYSELIQAIKDHTAEYSAFDTMITVESGANTYITKALKSVQKSALIVVDPPTCKGKTLGGAMFTSIWEVNMAFMIHLAQDSDWTARDAVVASAHTAAKNFLQRLAINAAGSEPFGISELTTYEILHFHAFTWNAMHVAGAVLKFTLVAEDTTDYCELEPLPEGTGIGYMTIGSTFIVS